MRAGEDAGRAHARADALESKRAERTWLARLLGLLPWPSESETEAALRSQGRIPADAGSTKRLEWRPIDPDAPAHDEMQTYLLARRAVAVGSADKQQMARLRSSLARAPYCLGRFDEALAENRNALAEVPAQDWSLIKDGLERLESDVAGWRDEGAALSRTEADRMTTLAREITELEQDPDVRRWLDKGR